MRLKKVEFKDLVIGKLYQITYITNPGVVMVFECANQDGELRFIRTPLSNSLCNKDVLNYVKYAGIGMPAPCVSYKNYLYEVISSSALVLKRKLNEV